MAGNISSKGAVRQVARPRPIVAILGRPNVGKSTLFNRLLKSRQSITNDQPGVTRDRIYAEVEWNGRRFTLVDTGGFIPRARDAMSAAVGIQAEMALAEADVAVLICDVTSGLTDLDREVARLMQRTQCPGLLVVNKVDQPHQEYLLDEFYQLGLGEPFPVSAATGRRSGDLLDAIIGLFGDTEYPPPEEEDRAIRVVLAGRPNVGKSTLVNRLAGDLVSIVHDQPGTTRDTTSIRINWQGNEFLLMDTAGLRRRTRVDDPIEYYSGRRAASSIETADVVIVLFDAVEGWTVQEARIINQVIEAGCGLILAANKWDLVDASEMSGREFTADLRDRFPFLADYPVLFISGLTGKRVQQCLEWVVRIQERRQRRIATARLNAFLDGLVQSTPPTGDGGDIRLFYATQSGVEPPAFVIFANRPDEINSAYRRYIEKKLRAEFGFEGTPIRLFWRRRRGR